MLRLGLPLRIPLTLVVSPSRLSQSGLLYTRVGHTDLQCAADTICVNVTVVTRRISGSSYLVATLTHQSNLEPCLLPTA